MADKQAEENADTEPGTFVAMVAPDGREWVAGSVTEINNLQAQGYRIRGSGEPVGVDALTSAPERPDNEPSDVADDEPVTTAGQTAPSGKGAQ